MTLKISEISDLKYFITYEVITSDPPAPMTSAIHTIQLRRVTKGSAVFVEWVSDFSSDATLEVIEDSRYKKLEAFGDLEKMVKK